MKLIKGTYSSRNGSILIISKVKTYEDLKNTFYICSIENGNGKIYEKTLVRPEVAKTLVRIGPYI